MFTNSSLRNFQESTYRTTVMAITIAIIKKYILNNDNINFDEDWLVTTLSKIVGFGLYDLFFYRIVDDSKFKTNEKHALKDILYFGGMLFMKEYVSSYYQGKEFDPNFIKNLTMLVVGFTLYHLFIKKIIFKIPDSGENDINKKSNSNMLEFVQKLFFGLVITDILPNYNNKDKILGHILPDLSVMVITIPFYFLIARKIFHKILE